MHTWRTLLLFYVASAYGTNVPRPSHGLHPALAAIVNQPSFIQQDDEVAGADERSGPAEIMVEEDIENGGGAGGAGDDFSKEDLDAMLTILIESGTIVPAADPQQGSDQSAGAGGFTGGPFSQVFQQVIDATAPFSLGVNSIFSPAAGLGTKAAIAAPLAGKAALVAAPIAKVKAKGLIGKALLSAKLKKKLKKIISVKHSKFGGAATAASGALLSPLLGLEQLGINLGLDQLGINLGLQPQIEAMVQEQQQQQALIRDLLESRLEAAGSEITGDGILDLTVGDILKLDLESNDINIGVGGQDVRTGQSGHHAFGLF